MDEKYLVIKRSHLDKVLVEVANRGQLNSMIGGILNEILSGELEDAVVIRRQDVFSAPALDAYAGAILAAVDVIQAADVYHPSVTRLLQIGDYFHEQAKLAWETNRKIPD